jgi:hypothetical protein
MMIAEKMDAASEAGTSLICGRNPSVVVRDFVNSSPTIDAGCELNRRRHCTPLNRYPMTFTKPLTGGFFFWSLLQVQ